MIYRKHLDPSNFNIVSILYFAGAALCRFTAEVDGRVIEGVVKAKEDAETEYQQAIRTGHTAFVVEEELPDVFKVGHIVLTNIRHGMTQLLFPYYNISNCNMKAKIGNLAEGTEAIIRLTYVAEMKVESGEIRFYLPTTIAPRYVPFSDKSSAADSLTSISYTLSVLLLLF